MTTEVLDPVAKAEYYYDYAGDDPINMTDPSGLCAWYDAWCAAKSVYNSMNGYLKGHRWARCALFVAGAVTIVGEYGRTGKALYDAYKGVRALKRGEILGRVGRNVGLVGSGGVIVSELTGGCISGIS